MLAVETINLDLRLEDSGTVKWQNIVHSSNSFVQFACIRGSAALVKTIQMKKALGETQTLRPGCSKAEPKNFSPQ